MTMKATPTDAALGAVVTGLELATITPAQAAELEALIAEHKVLSFPDQPLSIEELEAFILDSESK